MGPCPSVVRSSVVSWNMTITSSAVMCTSSVSQSDVPLSMPSEPSWIACANERSVFSGNSAEACLVSLSATYTAVAPAVRHSWRRRRHGSVPAHRAAAQDTLHRVPGRRCARTVHVDDRTCRDNQWRRRSPALGPRCLHRRCRLVARWRPLVEQHRVNDPELEHVHGHRK